MDFRAIYFPYTGNSWLTISPSHDSSIFMENITPLYITSWLNPLVSANNIFCLY